MVEDSVIHEKTREIKKDLRLAMNGVVSSIQRRQGLSYKINFGVEVPRLKGIASKYEKDEELAKRLWQDDIRECKMLAIFLMPEDSYPAIAESWISETPFTEIADHLAMNVLSKLPDAAEKAVEWIQNCEGMYRYCGFMTLTHLFRRDVPLNKELEDIYARVTRDIKDIDNRRTVIMAAQNSYVHFCEHFIEN